VHDFAVSHPLVVKGVYLVQKQLDFFVATEDTHLVDQISKLVFRDNTVLILIDLLEKNCERFQKALMLPQLVIQDSFLEIAVK
jgi:hypothetical protein